MIFRETIAEFYTNHGRDNEQQRPFNVYRRGEFSCHSIRLSFLRRGFYKISLVVEGTGVFATADKTVLIKNNAVTFTNPLIPYAWKPLTKNQTGYFCLFTEDFVSPILKNQSLSQSGLFKAGGNHVLFPDQAGMELFTNVFQSMLREMRTDYANKFDLIRSYVQILLHEALKMKSPESFYKPADSYQRISQLFLELLERQFSQEATEEFLLLKNANEFARELNIHTNTLNRALKNATGKTTSEWITERIVKEGKSLLLQTHLTIAEIAYRLGFEHASNFHAFFKKQTQLTPLQFKLNFVSIS